jgi:hypothetical protein
MKVLFFFITSLLSISAYTQPQDYMDSAKVTFLFPCKIAEDSSELTIKVIFHSTSRNAVFTYAKLVDGDSGDEDANIYFDFEKLDGLNYKSYIVSYYHKMSEIKTDSICRDVPKRKLHSLSTDTLSYNLLMIGGGFDAGKYRMKIHLRKNCKINLPKGDGDTWLSEIDYLASKWFYFQVNKAINPKIYNEEEYQFDK